VRRLNPLVPSLTSFNFKFRNAGDTDERRANESASVHVLVHVCITISNIDGKGVKENERDRELVVYISRGMFRTKAASNSAGDLIGMKVSAR